MPNRFGFLLALLGAMALSGGAAGNAGDDAAWSALKSGRHVVFIRHAATEPGIGDPEGFRLGDCSTQRNLSARGRADAKALGQAFRDRGIPVAEVLSSRWCRCLETAALAFGKGEPAAMLDSMFNDRRKPAEEKERVLRAYLARPAPPGNVVLVTHAQNIQALTGISPNTSELIVTVHENGRFTVVGRIETPQR